MPKTLKLIRKNKKQNNQSKKLITEKYTRKHKKGGKKNMRRYNQDSRRIKRLQISSLYQGDDDDEEEEEYDDEPGFLLNVDKQSIIDYWKDAYRTARDTELSYYKVKKIRKFLNHVTFIQPYTSLVPDVDENSALFKADVRNYEPKFRDNLDPHNVNSEYIALCNQANDAIESYLFVNGRFGSMHELFMYDP